jgi:competence protein ComGC
MAKLTKKSKTPRSTTSSTSNNKQGNPTLLIGVILAVGVGLLLFLFATNLQKTQNIVVAKGDIPAFTTIQKEQVEVVSVPADSVKSSDLTEATYNKYLRNNQAIVNRIEILPGQRVDINAISSSSLGTLAVVKSDEQVVAVSTTIPGAAGGVIVPGSVVDVYSSSGDNSQPLVTQAKVLGIGMGDQASAGVRPDSKVKDAGSGSGLIVLLAVKSSDAGRLLNQSQVALSYDPHKKFDAKGNICVVGKCATVLSTGTDTAQQSQGSVTPQGTAGDMTQTPSQPATTTPGG